MSLPTNKQLMSYLKKGRENAIIARTIAEHFGVSDKGEEVPIRKVIRKAINEDELIGSSSKGFYIIDEKSDFERYIRSLESRVSEIEKRIEDLRKNWKAKKN